MTSKRPKLASIAPRLATLTTSRVRMLEAQPGATPRVRGRAGVEARDEWLRTHPFCVDCLREGRRNALDPEVDHIEELTDGGADDDSNKQTLCKAHHAAKTAREAARRAGRSQ